MKNRWRYNCWGRSKKELARARSQESRSRIRHQEGERLNWARLVGQEVLVELKDWQRWSQRGQLDRSNRCLELINSKMRKWVSRWRSLMFRRIIWPVKVVNLQGNEVQRSSLNWSQRKAKGQIAHKANRWSLELTNYWVKPTSSWQMEMNHRTQTQANKTK